MIYQTISVLQLSIETHFGTLHIFLLPLILQDRGCKTKFDSDLSNSLSKSYWLKIQTLVWCVVGVIIKAALVLRSAAFFILIFVVAVVVVGFPNSLGKFSRNVQSCKILLNLAKSIKCKISSNLVKSCHILSYLVKSCESCHILLNFIESC